MNKKVMMKYSFDGMEVVTSDAQLLLWCMNKAGYTPDGDPEGPTSWRVVVGGHDTFAVTGEKEHADIVMDALRKVGIQTSVHVEPNT